MSGAQGSEDEAQKSSKKVGDASGGGIANAPASPASSTAPQAPPDEVPNKAVAPKTEQQLVKDMAGSRVTSGFQSRVERLKTRAEKWKKHWEKVPLIALILLLAAIGAPVFEVLNHGREFWEKFFPHTKLLIRPAQRHYEVASGSTLDIDIEVAVETNREVTLDDIVFSFNAQHRDGTGNGATLEVPPLSECFLADDKALDVPTLDKLSGKLPFKLKVTAKCEGTFKLEMSARSPAHKLKTDLAYVDVQVRPRFFNCVKEAAALPKSPLFMHFDGERLDIRPRRLSRLDEFKIMLAQ